MKYEELDKSFRDAFFFGFAISREGFNAEVFWESEGPMYFNDDYFGEKMNLEELRQEFEQSAVYKNLCVDAYKKYQDMQQ